MKILIAEDESYSRLSLVKQVRQYREDLQILVAVNGKQALEIFDQEMPEIVLSDIKMPFFSGIEVMNYALEKSPDTKVVIISGYAEFDYAQQAVNGGAAGYLLKPVDDEKLYKCLEKCIGDPNRPSEPAEDKNRKYAALYQALNDPNFRVPEGLLPPAEQGCRVVCALTPDEVFNTALLRFRVQKAFEKEPIGLIEISRRHLAVILHADPQFRGKLICLAQELADHDEKVILGVSGPLLSYADLAEGHRQARTALKYHILRNESVLWYPELVAAYPLRSVSFADEAVLKLYLKRRDTEAAYGLVFRALETARRDPQRSIEGYEHLLNRLTAVIRSIYEHYNVIFPEQEYRIDLTDIASFEELYGCIRGVIARACGAIADMEPDKEASIVADLIEFTKENFQSDISLRLLSQDVFYVNYTYLSHLFRKKTGVCFSDFLQNVRVEKAKDFLKKTSLSISEVATGIGYNDTSQFIQIFRKKTGMTPGHFRKAHTTEGDFNHDKEN